VANVAALEAMHLRGQDTALLRYGLGSARTVGMKAAEAKGDKRAARDAGVSPASARD